jgi:hypothetical protein
MCCCGYDYVSCCEFCGAKVRAFRIYRNTLFVVFRPNLLRSRSITVPGGGTTARGKKIVTLSPVRRSVTAYGTAVPDGKEGKGFIFYENEDERIIFYSSPVPVRKPVVRDGYGAEAEQEIIYRERIRLRRSLARNADRRKHI